MKNFLRIALVGIFLLNLPVSGAYAMDVSTAKSQGLIGERPDGLLGIVTPPGSADVQALVKKTNEGRMNIYVGMSQKQGVPLPQIQSIAAESLMIRTPPGQYILSNGAWVQK